MGRQWSNSVVQLVTRISLHPLRELDELCHICGARIEAGYDYKREWATPHGLRATCASDECAQSIAFDYYRR